MLKNKNLYSIYSLKSVTQHFWEYGSFTGKKMQKNLKNNLFWCFSWMKRGLAPASLHQMFFYSDRVLLTNIFEFLGAIFTVLSNQKAKNGQKMAENEVF